MTVTTEGPETTNGTALFAIGFPPFTISTNAVFGVAGGTWKLQMPLASSTKATDLPPSRICAPSGTDIRTVMRVPIAPTFGSNSRRSWAATKDPARRATHARRREAVSRSQCTPRRGAPQTSMRRYGPVADFPMSLVIGLLAGFFGAIPPGPLNVTCLRKGLQDQRREAYRVGGRRRGRGHLRVPPDRPRARVDPREGRHESVGARGSRALPRRLRASSSSTPVDAIARPWRRASRPPPPSPP